MAWVIGIDEAGYGPNLGPLVMTSVACRVPDELITRDLWAVLSSAARRHRDADAGQILVDDSKLVYDSGRGLLGLEQSVLTTIASWALAEPALTLTRYLDRMCPAAGAELCAEAWYGGASPLPTEKHETDLLSLAQRFTSACGSTGLGWGMVRSVVVCPARFNALVDKWDSKGAVLACALTELLRANCESAGEGESLHFFIDKHGGRNTYTAMLQDALPSGMVLPQEEGMNRSSYRVLGAAQELTITFQPRADAEHFCVALASMASKYLREVLMLEFNRFWQQHVPNIKPTAGYPSDAARFYAAIRPAMDKLGLSESAIWRRR